MTEMASNTSSDPILITVLSPPDYKLIFASYNFDFPTIETIEEHILQAFMQVSLLSLLFFV